MTSDGTSNSANAESNLTFDGSTLNVTGSVYISNTLNLSSQVFYTHGSNGFSVNENFDVSNNPNQTAYHFTSGDPARDSVVFSLARTGNFTSMFGVQGDAILNYFVIGSETPNTTFQIRSGLGVQPVNLSGGNLLFEVTSNSLSLPSIQSGTTETEILVRDGSGNIFYRSDLSLIGPTGPQGDTGATGSTGPAGATGPSLYQTSFINVSTYSTTFTYQYYGVIYTSGICTVTLPLGSSPADDGRFINIADEVGGVSWGNRGILVQGQSGQLINGISSVLMKIERMSLDFMFRNNSWKTI